MRHMLRVCVLATCSVRTISTTSTTRSTSAFRSTPNLHGSISASRLSPISAAMSSSASSTPVMKLPHAPHRYLSRPDTLDLTDLEKQINDADDRRQTAFDLSRKIGVALTRCKAASEVGGDVQLTADAELDSLMEEVFAKTASDGDTRKPRDGNLSYKVEDYLRYKGYCYFLSTGKLIPSSSFPSATDEEYLAGVCIGLAQDLARYGVGRATVRDADSVSIARDLVSDLMTYLLKFDFRNGPLRRKYDGVKYALKSLETVLYELSVTGSEIDVEMKDSTKDDEVSHRMPNEELEALRLRMERRDELREKLIKRCRDGQKAAKQSIFALHRGDKAKSEKLIHECESCIDDLLPIVKEEPALRYGSFSNVLEELVEARLYYSWLYGKDGSNEDKSPSGTILSISDFTTIEPEDYLGGICDLTGEVGRFAVQQGTRRNTQAVTLCLETNLSILLSLQGLSRFPSGGSLGKKMNPLRMSVEKLERMLYELSLVEATGGTRKIAVDSGMKQQSKDDGGAGGED